MVLVSHQIYNLYIMTLENTHTFVESVFLELSTLITQNLQTVRVTSLCFLRVFHRMRVK